MTPTARHLTLCLFPRNKTDGLDGVSFALEALEKMTLVAISDECHSTLTPPTIDGSFSADGKCFSGLLSIGKEIQKQEPFSSSLSTSILPSINSSNFFDITKPIP